MNSHTVTACWHSVKVILAMHVRRLVMKNGII